VKSITGERDVWNALLSLLPPPAASLNKQLHVSLHRKPNRTAVNVRVSGRVYLLGMPQTSLPGTLHRRLHWRRRWRELLHCRPSLKHRHLDAH